MHAAEARNRALKADRIATGLAPLQGRYPWLTTTHLADALPAERAAYARLAGCEPPSDETWDLVIGVLRQRENPPADPFAGVA